MFVSALSITLENAPLPTPMPAFGATQRLQEPTFTSAPLAGLGTVQQMQSLVGQMFEMLQMLMGRAPNAGSAQTASQSRQAIQTSNGAPPNANLKGGSGSDFGKQLAAQAERTAGRINTSGLCLKGVNDAMESMGLPVHREAAAWMAVDDFQKNPRFQEVKVPKDKLKSLPAGAVVIWDKGSGLPYGHISVALGDGREASSKVRDQLLLNTNFHVFLPK